jgi:hypothetical protein
MPFRDQEKDREWRRAYYRKNKEKLDARVQANHERKSAWWKEYKKQFVCAVCGESDPVCIEFHHPEGTKEFQISCCVQNKSRKNLLKELEKCIPLCCNCHKKLHSYDGIGVRIKNIKRKKDVQVQQKA